MSDSFARAYIYKNPDYTNPKYIFKYIATIINNVVENKSFKNFSCLDAGGASGAFLYYLNSKFGQKISTTLIDMDRELCRIANSNLTNTEVICGDVNNMHQIKNCEYDFVTSIGVISNFDDFKDSILEMIRVVKLGGTLIIFGQFNDYDIDAVIKYKNSGDHEYKNGYNLFSKKTLSSFLDTIKKVKEYGFEDFTLPFDIEQQEDKIRTWTFYCNGNRLLRNGLMEVSLKTLVIKC